MNKTQRYNIEIGATTNWWLDIRCSIRFSGGFFTEPTTFITAIEMVMMLEER
jgi:hypothetical protein